MKETTATFDPAQAVAAYRRVIAQRDLATGPKRADHDKTAQKLRKEWADWQGEDSLLEMAFGEPQE